MINTIWKGVLDAVPGHLSASGGKTRWEAEAGLLCKDGFCRIAVTGTEGGREGINFQVRGST